MAEEKYIQIKGARINNLKHIDVNIPRNKFVVITGLSGSGKSSLAFDTLYAEGQRRYVESLSSYARQFLGRLNKPECDYIKGLPPAIAIEQKVISRNPRSTVGTSSEIYEYLCLLFARAGHTFSPVSGMEVKHDTVEDIIKCMLDQPEGTRFTVLCPLGNRKPREGSPGKASEGSSEKAREGGPAETSMSEKMKRLKAEGFTRLEVNGEMVLIDEYKPRDSDTIFLLVDRLVSKNDNLTISRLSDSIETCSFESNGSCLLRFYGADGSTSLFRFSTRFEADGILFEEPSVHLFSFNSATGACPRCQGFGRVIGIDENLVIPNPSLSVYDGAVICWRGEKMGMWREMVIHGAEKAGFPIFTPYRELTPGQKQMLWKGTPYFEGLDAFFKMIEENQYKIQYRVMMARYRGKTECPDCHGGRLKPEATYVRVGGKNICELVNMSIDDLALFFDRLELNEHDRLVSSRLLVEIKTRLGFLRDVGLGYLTLNRMSNTLSGGESQRINLATQLGSSLVGSLYVLDEPSIGLHSRDTDRLIGVIRKLQRLGNTVVVVEHDEEIIRAADYIIDIGPHAGRLGGEVVYAGDMSDLSEEKAERSYTVKYLLGMEQIEVPATRRKWNDYIDLKGVYENNLKGVNVRFPLNVMTVVTGVSGSGKSSLVRRVFYPALQRELDECDERPGIFSSIEGNISSLRHVEFVDQNPIGKSTRSNPVTYIKVYEDIRKLWAEQPLAKQLGFGPGYFSFNSEGGRCDDCKGEGTITIEMQFMADIVMKCETCDGQRFKKDVLEVRYHNMNINDLLNMTVNQAIEFFEQYGPQKIARKLKPLQDVGLGYIKLGQSSSTLSGGENQRVKLAYILSQEKTEPTMFIFDEPTTGLHFHDIKKLLEAFDALLRRGHTVLIIEHNPDVIKCADHVIDVGPEGGDKGGYIVATGTPEEIAACPESYTGRFLKEKL